LRSSSSCRRSGGWPAAACLPAALVALAASATARAADPDRALTQYIRDRWESSRGFPGGPVNAITQTADGFLWIAAEKGLVRFDGVTFRLFQPAEASVGADTVALELAPDATGGLWARLRRAAFVRYGDGAFDGVFPSADRPQAVVTAMGPTADGSILLADRGRGLFRARGERVESVSSDALARAFVISIAQTPTGEIWLGTWDAGLLRLREGRVTPIAEGLPDLKVNCLVVDGRGGLWVGTDNGVARWDGARVTTEDVPASLARVRVTAMMKDRDANLWIGSAEGLFRLNGRGEAALDPRGPGSGVTALFEDRDDNVWVGTPRGIERWRDGAFTTFPEVNATAAGDAGPVFVDAALRKWFAPSSGGLYWLRDGHVAQVPIGGPGGDVVYSIGGSGEDIWIGRQRGGLTHIRPRGGAYTTETFTQKDGLAQDQVYAVHQATDGAVWAGTLSGGASRLKDGAFTTYTTADGLASNTVSSVLQTADGTLWFGTPNGASALSAGGWRRFSIEDGLPSNAVNTLFEDSARDLWVGTAAGLAVVREGHVDRALRVPAPLRASVLGLAEDRAGGLWIASADRVMRVDRERLRRGALDEAGVREYGAADGLLGIEGVKRYRSLVSGPRGFVWVSTSGGLAMADPVRAAGRSAPALVHVEEVSADGVPLGHGRDLRVPPRRQRITFAFTALSLSVPERIRFRYRLNGFDQEWSEPVAVRQAVYANLGPGDYRFRVVASNGDGEWNSDEAAVSFTIEPAFWQAAWFRLGAVLLVAASAWAAYRVRVLQLSRRLNLRFEERLAERTRIAQELHDTLLQGFVSASMQLHVATARLPAGSPAKSSFDRVNDLVRRVIDEGRNAVRGLRSPGMAAVDLERAFAGVHEELGIESTVEYRVSVEGTSRAVSPIVRDEAYRIGREAVVNAVRHARARRIEVEVEYTAAALRIVVQDDGCGIDPEVLASGSPGHWGLPGMHERAARIGARFKVVSRIGAGTAVELSVPARVAFARE
jgi:signal transduction histidine kinase/ligand-binding sensor domain-containing protein